MPAEQPRAKKGTTEPQRTPSCRLYAGRPQDPQQLQHAVGCTRPPSPTRALQVGPPEHSHAVTVALAERRRRGACRESGGLVRSLAAAAAAAIAGAMVGGEATSAVEKLVSGVRQAADFAEQFRSYSESEKQWKARMEFILRHLPDYRDPPDGGGRLDQLLSLSMVWANHLFLGCSYNKDLLDKVMEMADGIEVEDLPQFTSRSELMKKHQS